MRFLLLQVRNPDDPMRENELQAFSRATGYPREQIAVLDCLTEAITPTRLSDVDIVLIGGSGSYSACGTGAWLDRTLGGLRMIYDTRKPLLASCWGFQALARALGGTVINDPARAEIGTHTLQLTAAGRCDPLFGSLPPTFLAQMGHEDRVSRLPPEAVLLAYNDVGENQAYTFPGRPIYATQFHPELSPEDMRERVAQYPEYLRLVTGLTYEQFCEQTLPTPECAALVLTFVQMVRDGRASERQP